MILYKDKALLLIESDRKLPRVWLIFGSDQTSLQELVLKIKNRLITDNCQVIKLTAKDQDLPAIFLQKSLFHDRKVIILEEVSDSLTQGLEKALPFLGQDDYLLLLAEDLKKNSSLRSLIEKDEDFIAVNCYRLESFALVTQIEKQLKERKINFTKEIPSKIAELVQRDLIPRELDKLELFFLGRRDRLLTEALIESLIIVKPEASLDKVFTTIVLKRDKDFCREMNKIINNDINPIFFIRSLQNFLERIILVQEKFFSIGKDAALNCLNPPLFGEAKRVFLEIAQGSLLKSNIKLFERSLEIERVIKDKSHKELETIYQFFLKDVTGFNRG